MLRSRLIRAAAFVAMCVCALVALPDVAQARTQYIFLIDTSGSMIGLPEGSGNAVIFPKVKAELIRYVTGLDLGDVVDLRTFQDGVQTEVTFRLDSESARRRAIAHIRGLQAGGGTGQTHIYRSILDTARDKSEVAKRLDALEVPTIFYVLTDGLDNDPQRQTMRDMLDEYAELRQENDFLIYVTLSASLSPADVRALEDSPHASHHPNPEDVVRIGTIEIRARRLDFGFIEEEYSNPRSLALQLSNLDDSEVSLDLEPWFPEVEASGAVVELEPATVGLEESRGIRLRIVNRDSLPEDRFEGEIRLSTDRPYVHVVPDRIAVALSTVPGSAATLTLPEQAQQLDFGELRAGAGMASTLRARVELNASARSERSGFYLEVVPAEEDLPAPTAIWNGKPVSATGLLTSNERFNDLLFVWEETPGTVTTYRGEVRLLPERLELLGDALVATGKSGYAIPYRLQIRPPAWTRLLFGAAVLMALLVVLGTTLWVVGGKPPWAALRLWLVGNGLASPRLYGKLVYYPPDGARSELLLCGSKPVLLGAGTGQWNDLPDRIEVVPRLRKNMEVVTAQRRAGDISHRSMGSLVPEPLSGQALSHLDTLILSNRYEITFIHDRHR